MLVMCSHVLAYDDALTDNQSLILISSFVLLSGFLDLHQVLLPGGVGPTEPRSAADGLSSLQRGG